MRQRKVAITGITGQLGQAFNALAEKHWRINGVGSADLDVTNWQSVRDWIAFFQPDIVIHCAAETNVDGCEDDIDRAFQVNALGTRYIARATAAVEAELVYISTNFVFDGTKQAPYHEYDIPNPISVYGASKLAGEIEARQATSRLFVVRTAMVFAERGRNFVNTMVQLMQARDEISVVSDQFANPTYAPDLASAVAQLIRHGPYGTYHLTNSGVTSWHAWAREIARGVGTSTRINPIAASEYTRAATPPTNGALQSLALADLDISLPSWQDALERCLST